MTTAIVVGGKLDTHTTVFEFSKVKELIDKGQFASKDKYERLQGVMLFDGAPAKLTTGCFFSGEWRAAGMLEFYVVSGPVGVCGDDHVGLVVE